MNKSTIFFLVIFLGFSCFYANTATLADNKLSIARLHYDGGGDWYNDREILPNLLKHWHQLFATPVADEEVVVRLTDSNLYQHPILFMTGHGNITFSAMDIQVLRDYLSGGGFLYADDDFGMDVSFRREIQRIFPEYVLTELPPDFSIFTQPISLGKLPKIHEHEEGPPVAYGIFHEGRMVVLYTFNTNISDGWADERTHNDPLPVRQAALDMGINILHYVMNH